MFTTVFLFQNINAVSEDMLRQSHPNESASPHMLLW